MNYKTNVLTFKLLLALLISSMFLAAPKRKQVQAPATPKISPKAKSSPALRRLNTKSSPLPKAPPVRGSSIPRGPPAKAKAPVDTNTLSERPKAKATVEHTTASERRDSLFLAGLISPALTITATPVLTATPALTSIVNVEDGNKPAKQEQPKPTQAETNSQHVMKKARIDNSSQKPIAELALTSSRLLNESSNLKAYVNNLKSALKSDVNNLKEKSAKREAELSALRQILELEKAKAADMVKKHNEMTRSLAELKSKIAEDNEKMAKFMKKSKTRYLSFIIGSFALFGFTVLVIIFKNHYAKNKRELKIFRISKIFQVFRNILLRLRRRQF